MINVALIGFGLSGRTIQAPFFQTNSRFRLKSIVTSRPIPKDLFPEAIACSSIEEILANKDIDLVSICSPSHTHYPYALKCLHAGKHILIDKPVADNCKEANEIFQLAKDKSLVTAVFQNRRFDGDFLTVKELIQSGQLGDIISFEARYDRYKPELHTKKWKEEVAPGNGIIYDLGPHIIDQAIHLFGAHQSIQGRAFTERKDSLIKDAFNIKMKMNGIDVMLSSSLLVKEPTPRYVLTGTLGKFIKYGVDTQEDHLNANHWPGMENFGRDNNQGFIYTKKNNKDQNYIIPTLPGNWMILFDSLANAILEGRPYCIDNKDILQQMSIINEVLGNS
jgi:scyllo-inositol 2-dehydrogenase (NADP+)